MIALHAMRSGCPNGQGGNNFQHKRDAGTLPSFQDVTSVPVVYPRSGIKISMLTTAYPGELRGTYTPAQLQREGVQAQQTFQGLHYQQETQASIQSTQCQHRCYPVTASYSLQTDIRKENLSDSKSFDTPSWSEKSNGNIERQQGQQVRGSLAAPNCGYTRTHNLEHSGGTPSILPVLPDGESQIYAQIEDYIAKKLAYFRTVLTHNNSHYGHSHKEWDEDPTLQSPCIMPNVHSVVHLPTTSAADKDVEGQTLNCAVIEQRTVAVGQAVEEDSSKGIKANTEFMTTSKEIDGYATSASEKHSTEYPKILTAAATCTKKEYGGPVVLTTVPGRTWDEHAKKPTSSMLNRRSSQEEYKFRRVTKKNLRTQETPSTSNGSSKDLTKGENRVSALKNVEAKGLDIVPCATEVLKGLQNKSGSVVTENKTFELVPLIKNQDAKTKDIKTLDQQHQGVTCQKVMSHSKLNVSDDVPIPTNQSPWLCIQTDAVGVKDEGAVCVETDLSMALSENKVEKHASLSESEGEEALKQSPYENITDDETPQLATEIPQTEHGELSFPACYEAPQYEDISDEESPNTEIVAVELSSPTQVPEPKDKQSSIGNEGFGHVQGQAQMEAEVISDEELIPKKEDGGFEGLIYPKCDSEGETNHSVSCSFSSLSSDEDETDDQMDDYLVIPICVSSLKFEPENEDWNSPEKCVPYNPPPCSVSPSSRTSPTPRSPQEPVLASAFPSLEVFETQESFLQAKAVQFQKKKELYSGWNTPDAEMEPHAPQNRRESIDSCDTDDSCDYPPPPENKFLIVSRLFKKKSSPDDIIKLDSDTDDATQTANCKNTAKRKKLKKNRRPSADLLTPQHQSKLQDTLSEDEIQADPLHNAEKNGQLAETKPNSEHFHKTNRQKLSEKESVINLISDTDDENEKTYKKPSRKRFFPSGSDSDDAPFAELMRRSPETVHCEYGTAQEKLSETRLCSDLSHSIKKNGHLTEVKCGSEHVQPKNGRQTISKRREDSDKLVKKKRTKEGQISSASEDGNDALFATKQQPSTKTADHLYGTANETPDKHRLSSEGSPGKQPCSLEKKAVRGPNPGVARLAIGKPFPPNKNLKLLKLHAVIRKRTDGTMSAKTFTASSQKTDSCVRDEPTLNTTKEVRLAVNDAVKQNVQANVTKPRMDSRQVSLLGQEVPSDASSSLSPTSGQLSEARKSSASSQDLSPPRESSTSLPTSKQSTSMPRQHLSSSKLQRSHSYSTTSTSIHSCTPTKGNSSRATIQLSARERLNRECANNFIPIRGDRRSSLGMEENVRTNPIRGDRRSSLGMEEDLRTNDLWREPRPGPSHHERAPKQRHSSQKLETPLMKKTKTDAVQWTKAINKDPQREKRASVGEGYKWSEKPTKADYFPEPDFFRVRKKYRYSQ